MKALNDALTKHIHIINIKEDANKTAHIQHVNYDEFEQNKKRVTKHGMNNIKNQNKSNVAKATAS